MLLLMFHSTLSQNHHYYYHYYYYKYFLYYYEAHYMLTMSYVQTCAVQKTDTVTHSENIRWRAAHILKELFF